MEFLNFKLTKCITPEFKIFAWKIEWIALWAGSIFLTPNNVMGHCCYLIAVKDIHKLTNILGMSKLFHKGPCRCRFLFQPVNSTQFDQSTFWRLRSVDWAAARLKRKPETTSAFCGIVWTWLKYMNLDRWHCCSISVTWTHTNVAEPFVSQWALDAIWVLSHMYLEVWLVP